MDKFEEILNTMTKPEVDQLKHQELLSDAISKAKERSVLSWWWIIIPAYLVAALIMKTAYVPHSTFLSNLNDLTSRNRYSSIFIFLVIPVAVILLNLFSIKKVYYLSGSPKSLAFLGIVWFNLLLIFASVVLILIYIL